MKNRKYKDPAIQKVYDGYFAAASDVNSFVYRNGEPRRGSATRCAFWDGYNGIRTTYTARGTFGYAAYMAGKDFRSQEQQ